MSELLTEQISHDELLNKLQEFYSYAKKRLKIDRDPTIILKRDNSNSEDFLGKTGYYDPEEEKVVLYIIDRHAKDIVRSLSHELIHHAQKIRGFTDNIDLSDTGSDPSYALHNKDLRKMEKQAFLWGDMIFRDWTDKEKIKRKNIMAEKKQSSVDIPSSKEKQYRHKTGLEIKKLKDKHGISNKGAYAGAIAKKKMGLQDMDEGSKPDFLDLDKDGNKKEPMRLAAKQAKKSIKKENTMKLKLQNKKMIDEVQDEEEELTGILDPESGSEPEHDYVPAKNVTKRDPNAVRNPSAEKAADEYTASVMKGRGEEEGQEQEEEEEDLRTGGKNPQKTKEQIAFEERFGDMSPDMQARFLVSMAQKAKDKKAAEIALKAELAREETGQEEPPKAAQKSGYEEGSPEYEELMASLGESKKNPYPVLFEQRERLLKDAFQTREERVYNELVKRFIKK